MGMRLLPLTVVELNVHALMLEREVMRRYGAYAQRMRHLGVWPVAAVFEQLFGTARERVAELQEEVGDRRSEQHSPWDYAWRLAYYPEAVENRPRLVPASPREALQLALVARQRAIDYYEDVSQSAQDGEVRRQAATLLDAAREVPRLEHCLAGEISSEQMLATHGENRLRA